MRALWSRKGQVSSVSPLGELLTSWSAIEALWPEPAAIITGGPMIPGTVNFYEPADAGAVVGFERRTIEMGPSLRWISERPARSAVRAGSGR